MRIIFFGTSEFARLPLEALIKSRHEVVCCVTQPQRKKGRGLKLMPGPIEECALKESLSLLKFEDINSQEAAQSLKSMLPDLFVVCAFGQILDDNILNIPRIYSVNIHASLLPKYRGASPVQRAVLNGDKITGISIMKMNSLLDRGDIISSEEITIDNNDDAIRLAEKLSSLSAGIIVKTVDEIESGMARPVPQDEKQATCAPKLVKEDGLICWGNDAGDILNKIRGCKPWPSAYTYLDKKLLKIHEAEKAYIEFCPGTVPGEVVLSHGHTLLVACGMAGLKINTLQLEGRKALNTDEFLRGYGVKKGTTLGKRRTWKRTMSP